jgi:hypothetical protein
MRRVVIDPGDDGTAQADVRHPVGGKEILPDYLPVIAYYPLIEGEGAFIIKEQEVRQPRKRQQCFPWTAAAGFYAEMQFFPAYPFGQRQGELRLGEGLAAGKGDTATAFLIKGTIPEEPFHYLIDSHPLTGHFQRAGGADGGAFAAGEAVLPGKAVGRIELMTAPGADGAPAAADAFIGVKGNLGKGGEPLGIVAPGAAKGAALQKDRGTYTRPVMDGKALYIEQDPPHCGISSG